MEQVTLVDIRGKLYLPPPSSHKGQNGKLLLIGGSKLFHAASLWALRVASKIVDMVYYSSIPDNNEIVLAAKKEFQDGIVIRRDQIDDYIKEADCVLIGPGLPRKEGLQAGDDDTRTLTQKLLQQYPKKKWVIDGGSLQMMEKEWIPKNAILTPHKREFTRLFGNPFHFHFNNIYYHSDYLEKWVSFVDKQAKEYQCVILTKGLVDVICPPVGGCKIVQGGNAGMTKGGTGDVLAGLVAGLYCKNDAFLSALSGSFINKRVGEALFDRVGYYFNASDLVEEIPKVMKKILL